MAPRVKPAPIFVPTQPTTPFKLTNSGTFTEGDLTINRNGLRLAGMECNVGTPTPTGEALARAVTLSDLQHTPERPSSADSQGSSSPVEGRMALTPAAAGSKEEAPSTSQGEAAAGDAGGGGEGAVMGLAELEVITSVGMGSSGVVNKVKRKGTGEVYALKMIQMDMQEQVRKNILQELRTLHKAQCSHIVQCYGSFYDNGIIYSVLEFMDGGSLAHILKQHKRMSERHLAKIAKQVLTGLTYLHKELHVIHRDVKPCNLLVNHAGEVKISDFGVSGKLANSVADCASWVGTVTYMSPERISGNCYSFDSDVWSLGLSIMECAEGRFPYPPSAELGNGGHALSFWDLLDYIVERPPPHPQPAQHSAEFCDFIAACLQKEPKKRATTTDLMAHPFIAKYDAEPDSIVAELLTKT